MKNTATRATNNNSRRLTTAAALVAAFVFVAFARTARADDAELILHHGRIVTVDPDFSIVEALAVREGRIVKTGSSADVLKLRGERTEVIDLDGKMVLPGLIDSHVHPTDASVTEFDHEIPELKSINDVLHHIRERARVVENGKWIEVHQVFITRLAEQRYPTRAELDQAAPSHPVAFMTGPDASLNSLALQRNGIDKNFQVVGTGEVERDPVTGEPTGVLHGCNRYIKTESSEKHPGEEQRLERLKQLFTDYNAVGLTTVGDKAASSSAVDRYRHLVETRQLTVRMAISRLIETDGQLEAIRDAIRKVGSDPLVKGDSMLWIVGIKTFLDGGMLTGSALMRDPWGVSQIYSIRDPQYRGVRFMPQERLIPIVEATVEAGLQFTAHSVGDGAVQALLDAYEDVNRRHPIRDTRPSITHSNFMSRESVGRAARLGVVEDIQPAWLYLDGKTLLAHFGYERLRYFQPLKSIFEAGGVAGGGSDHMQKIGPRRSINFYDPWLAMETAVARIPRGLDTPLHPEEALDRRQMIRFYTANNAFLLRREKEIGSLETGKLADFILVDTNLLECPVEAISETKVLATYLGGKRIFARPVATGVGGSPESQIENIKQLQHDVVPLQVKVLVKTESGDSKWLTTLVDSDGVSASGTVIGIDLGDRQNPHFKDYKLNESVDDKWLARLLDFPDLQNLDIANTNVQGPGLEHVGKLTALELLNLTLTPITDPALAHLRGLTKLKVLGLASTKVTGEGLKDLAGLTALVNLNCHFTPVNDAGLREIGRLTSLERLEIVHTHFTDAGAAPLANLVNLKRLQIGSRDATGAAVAHLAGLAKLEELDLSDNQPTLEGLKYANQILSLRVLRISQGDAKNDGVACLTKLPNLEQLVLLQTGVTDAGLEHLARCTKLRKLEIQEPGVTEAGLAKLRQAMPQLEITR